jgi:hypothetical protein
MLLLYWFVNLKRLQTDSLGRKDMKTGRQEEKREEEKKKKMMMTMRMTTTTTTTMMMMIKWFAWNGRMREIKTLSTVEWIIE